MHVGLLYTTDWAHPSQKGLEGCDIGQLMAALEVNNRPRWAIEFSLSFIRPLTVHEYKYVRSITETHRHKKNQRSTNQIVRPDVSLIYSSQHIAFLKDDVAF